MDSPFHAWKIGETVAWRGVACRVVRQLSRRDAQGYAMLFLEEIGVPDTFHTVSSRYVHPDPGEPRSEPRGDSGDA